MRVLVVTNDLPPRVGGIQNYVDELCRGLVRAGDDVTLYGSSYEGDAAWDAAAPFRVVREPRSVLLPSHRTFRHTLRLVEHTRPDVVVFGAAFPLGLMGPALRRRTGVPYVAFTHGLEVSSVRAPGGRRLLRAIGAEAGAVTFVSHWCDDLLRDAFGPGPRYALLPPAVDPEAFHPGVDGTPIRERYGVGDDPVVVCVSRAVERKGQDQLIRCLPELRRRVPGAQLLLVGGGPHLDRLRELVTETGVGDHVTITGQVADDELPAHYAAGDVFAMPCRERRGGLEVEAFGIVFIQAQAVGRPVVAGRIGGVPDALDEGTTGLLVDGEDAAALVDGIASLLGDPERATRMGEAGQRFVRDGFTWGRRTDQLRALLADVVAGS
ncbi:MAG: glycosyltransferase family 4 protein [Microthrixaceae bacterium]